MHMHNGAMQRLCWAGWWTTVCLENSAGMSSASADRDLNWLSCPPCNNGWHADFPAQEYRQLKESIMKNTRTAGATLGVYLLVTVSGSVQMVHWRGDSVQLGGTLSTGVVTAPGSVRNGALAW
eukprot:364790-Chlamydomonas_euryale.AAC.17